MRILTIDDLEGAALKYGLLPFFRNNIKGFSIEEMTPPALIFGGNDDEGCWEWKGPVIRRRTTMYGKFFRRKAGFVSRELIPYFLKMRRDSGIVTPGSTDEMIFDIISINDRMTSTELRETLIGKPKRRTAYDLPELEATSDPGFNLTSEKGAGKPSRHTLEGPLQRLQMGGHVCISDFRYKQTRRGERYGWGVAEYSTPEMLFESSELHTDLTPGECRDYIIEYVGSRFPSASADGIGRLIRM
ncbi:MAG: hypothetical protein J1F07_04830 [Muribaculaceae bacterium]|nr:hypothetical protein [Muribaculaceae bacterium]